MISIPFFTSSRTSLVSSVKGHPCIDQAVSAASVGHQAFALTLPSSWRSFLSESVAGFSRPLGPGLPVIISGSRSLSILFQLHTPRPRTSSVPLTLFSFVLLLTRCMSYLLFIIHFFLLACELCMGGGLFQVVHRYVCVCHS